MPKAATLIIIVVVLVLSPASAWKLHAGTVAGVTLPDAVQALNTTLLLNGMGLRTKYMVKVYVAGLYLPHKSSDPNAIMKADVPKRISHASGARGKQEPT